MRGILDVGFRFVEHINRLELDELVALMTGYAPGHRTEDEGVSFVTNAAPSCILEAEPPTTAPVDDVAIQGGPRCHGNPLFPPA